MDVASSPLDMWTSLEEVALGYISHRQRLKRIQEEPLNYHVLVRGDNQSDQTDPLNYELERLAISRLSGRRGY